jgi:hypothetical protein
MAPTLCTVCHKPCPPHPEGGPVVCSLTCFDAQTIREHRAALKAPAAPRSLDDILLELATPDWPRDSAEVIARELTRLSARVVSP